MRILYLDCFSGISGDMTVGALVDAGVPPEKIEAELKKLPLSGYQLQWDRVVKKGIYATKFEVMMQESAMDHHDHESHHAHRHYSDIIDMICRSELSSEVKKRSKQIFHCIAVAEAKIHGMPVEKVHFHEVGAVDSIVDIVATAVALTELNVDYIVSAPVPLGCGSICCAHGTYPVPAPATLEILQGVPIRSSHLSFELTTPTGAGIIKSQVNSYGPLPSMKVSAIGYGAGARDLPDQPNVLRVVIGEGAHARADSLSSSHLEEETVYILECQLDDMPGEALGYVMDRLFQKGALDVYYTPVFMKKNRPGVLLTVLASAPHVEQCEQFVLKETTTLGIRKDIWMRKVLEREVVSVATSYGNIRVKQAIHQGKVIRQMPEYEDVKEAALAHQAAFLDVYAEAAQQARKKIKGE
ncbi:nickel pincer cofactor biosynthesis protein LarC [Geobacillus thermodenitrificans]|uniref:nickel pincer cofactor biosynthesis protein LarC n=1 Tax=Geobacillus thermodenitrificans TaxID=33940 RepID=UPI002E1AEB7F|nr:nickel pincer cofactor biosynthesis protein LarC [Geobacillus thermodenitrificans]